MSVVDPDTAGLDALCDGQRTGVVAAPRAQLEIFLWHLGTFNYSCRPRRRTLPRDGCLYGLVDEVAQCLREPLSGVAHRCCLGSSVR
jgi:hypothetical protein